MPAPASMAAWPYLFAGIPVGDYAAALAWYERLLGSPPSFFPHDTEAVWELAEHRSVFIVQQPEHAGHAMHTIIVDDLDTVVVPADDPGRRGSRRTTHAHPQGRALFDPLESDRPMHAGIRVWQERRRQDRRQVLTSTDAQLSQLLWRQLRHQLIDSPPNRPVPDTNCQSACFVLGGHAPSVRDHHRCGHGEARPRPERSPPPLRHLTASSSTAPTPRKPGAGPSRSPGASADLPRSLRYLPLVLPAASLTAWLRASGGRRHALVGQAHDGWDGPQQRQARCLMAWPARPRLVIPGQWRGRTGPGSAARYIVL